LTRANPELKKINIKLAVSDLLGRLRVKVDKIQPALTKISAHFTEDFDTGDLKDGKALLDELCSQNDLLRVQLRSPTPRQCVHVPVGRLRQRKGSI
jgi:hypothetical protein